MIDRRQILGAGLLGLFLGTRRFFPLAEKVQALPPEPAPIVEPAWFQLKMSPVQGPLGIHPHEWVPVEAAFDEDGRVIFKEDTPKCVLPDWDGKLYEDQQYLDEQAQELLARAREARLKARTEEVESLGFKRRPRT